eukprot:2961884-Prymnesium_polylepis.1
MCGGAARATHPRHPPAPRRPLLVRPQGGACAGAAPRAPCLCGRPPAHRLLSRAQLFGRVATAAW